MFPLGWGGGWFIFHLKIKEVTFDVLFTIIKLRKLEIYPNCGNCKNACNTRDLVTCQMNKKENHDVTKVMN